MSRRSSMLGLPSHASTALGRSTSSSSASHTRRTTLDASLDPPPVDVLLSLKERQCEQLVDQVEMLQRQLASRPPKSEIDSLRSEFRIQESLLSGFQRENEKAMKDLERAKARERLLEAELEKLVGPNWAISLNLPSSSTPQSSPSLSHSSPRFPTSAPLARLGSTPLASSFVPSMETSFLSSFSNQEDNNSTFEDGGSSGDEVEGAVFSPVKVRQTLLQTTQIPPSPIPTHSPFLPPSAEARHADQNALKELESVRLLVRGMEGRLASREEELLGLISRAEKESELWTRRAEGVV